MSSRACTPATTSNQADLDGIAAADLGTADVGEASDGRSGCGGLDKITSVGVGGLAHWVFRCPMGGYGRVSALPFKVLGPLRGEMSLLSTGAEHLFTSSQGLLLGDQVSAAEIP